MQKYGLGNLENQAHLYEAILEQGLEYITELKKSINQPSYDKAKKTFSMTEVASMLNIPRQTLRSKELANVFKYLSEIDITNKKREYSLSHINEIRQHFNKGFFNGNIVRPNSYEAMIIAFSMFKGGVGKTTHACHLAAHCAIEGLKTLIIDLDPQASATFMFGYVPSIDIVPGNTIYSALIKNFEAIFDIIKPTHYDGLDIITSGLELQGADICLPNHELNNSSKLGSPLLRLSQALLLLKDKYDVIILDCAPNHASVTLNGLAAANSIIIPVSPNMLSFGSSIHFMQTLFELATTLLAERNKRANSDSGMAFLAERAKRKEEAKLLNQFEKNLKEMRLMPPPKTEERAAQLSEILQEELGILEDLTNRIFRILITNDQGDSEAQSSTALIRGLYGDYVLPRPMSKTIALSRATNDISLLYDQKRSDVRKSKESFDRGLSCMKEVNNDILTLMSSVWEGGL